MHYVRVEGPLGSTQGTGTQCLLLTKGALSYIQAAALLQRMQSPPEDEGEANLFCPRLPKKSITQPQRAQHLIYHCALLSIESTASLHGVSRVCVFLLPPVGYIWPTAPPYCL